MGNAQGFESFDKAFARFDKDNSGVIELNEIRDLVEYLGHEVTDERLKEIFEKFDVDKSGGLDKDEVRKMVKELKPDYYKKITESNPHSLYA